MRVAICHTKNAPNANRCLEAAYNGVGECGDTPVKITQANAHKIYGCEAMIQMCEYNKVAGKDFRWWLKRVSNKKLIPRLIMDTGYIRNGRLKGSPDFHDRYMACSWQSIKGLGVSLNKNSPPDRWDKLGVSLKPWRKPKGSSQRILVLGQHETGTSTQHINVIDWFQEVIAELPRYTRRPIVMRKHPNQTEFPEGDYRILKDGFTIEEDLRDTWCVIARTTNGAVDAIMNGIPVITPDDMSMAYPVSAHDLCEVEDPYMPDRTQWGYDIAYAQWKITEIGYGTMWQHMGKGVMR